MIETMHKLYIKKEELLRYLTKNLQNEESIFK